MVRNILAAHLRQTLLGEDAIAQARLLTREGGYRLTSSVSIRHATYIGSTALVVARIVTLRSGPDLQAYLECLLDKYVAVALIESLKEISSVAKPQQLMDAVGHDAPPSHSGVIQTTEGWEFPSRRPAPRTRSQEREWSIRRGNRRRERR